MMEMAVAVAVAATYLGHAKRFCCQRYDVIVAQYEFPLLNRPSPERSRVAVCPLLISEAHHGGTSAVRDRGPAPLPLRPSKGMVTQDPNCRVDYDVW